MISQTTTEAEGAVHGLVAARFARADEERMKQLDRLIRSGRGNDPQDEDDLVLPERGAETQGDVMPRGKRAEPWPCCGSKSTRHLMGCEQHGKKATSSTKPTPERLARIVAATNRVKREPERKKAGLDEMTVPELLELRDQVLAELESREEELVAQLAAIRGKKAEAA